jgi:hypothetical protein
MSGKGKQNGDNVKVGRLWIVFVALVREDIDK